MKHSEFQDTHHWLCGLSEYFRFTEAHDEDFELIFRALYHDNKYRKRDLIINMAKKYARKELASIKDAKLEQMDDKLQSFFNIAMHSELDDYDIKARQLIGFLAWYIPGESLLERTSRFMAYFANQDLDIPNLGDFYSRGQVKSKLWLTQELTKILGQEPIGNVVFYGGWYNFIAHSFEQFNVDKIFSIDIDEAVVGPCKRLYAEELDDGRFIPITTDVNKIRSKDNTMHTYSTELEQKHKDAMQILPQDVYDNSFIDRGQIDLVINTSCEHMDNTWYENLPAGTLVVLHQNDYFSNEQHVNCMKDVEDTKQKYPMSEILYEGTLDTHLYNRFMLIGRK